VPFEFGINALTYIAASKKGKSQAEPKTGDPSTSNEPPQTSTEESSSGDNANSGPLPAEASRSATPPRRRNPTPTTDDLATRASSSPTIETTAVASTAPNSGAAKAPILTRLRKRFFPKREEDPALRVRNTTTLVSAEPEVRIHTRQPGEDFVVIASDGLWDMITTSQLASLVQKYFKKHGTQDLSYISQLLAEDAALRGSQDDITLVLLRLHPINGN